MEIKYLNAGKTQTIMTDGITFILGPNKSGKTSLLQKLKEGFQGLEESFLINGSHVYKKDYHVIYLDDKTDFTTEFKFTKTNLFREMIYQDIIKEFNTEETLSKINQLFDCIDDKVNQLLDTNINVKSDNHLKFDIKINNLEQIIDRFTEVYVNDIILEKDQLSRSSKRILIYNLLQFLLNNSKEETNIVFIDNFDLYLDKRNTKKIINQLVEYRKNNENTYFFLTTSNNIYDLIPQIKSIYHLDKGFCTKIFSLTKIIETTINQSQTKSKNEPPLNLLLQEEIDKMSTTFIKKNAHNIGELLTNSTISIKDINEEESKDTPTIYYQNKIEKKIYSSIAKELKIKVDK